jgi:hypothetical protein
MPIRRRTNRKFKKCPPKPRTLTQLTGTGESINQSRSRGNTPTSSPAHGAGKSKKGSGLTPPTTSGEQKIQEPPIHQPRTQRLTRRTLPPFPVKQNPQEKPETMFPIRARRGGAGSRPRNRQGFRSAGARVVVRTWSCSMGKGPCSTSSCCSAPAALCCCAAAADMTPRVLVLLSLSLLSGAASRCLFQGNWERAGTQKRCGLLLS